MPPRSLLGLPEEVLLYIVESACEGEKFTRIYNLLFVNRQISRLALPFLYRHIRDRDFVDEEYDAFRKLVLTLLFNPDKAKFVHSFSIEQGGEHGEGPSLADAKGDAELKEHGYTAEQHAELQQIIDVLSEYEDGEEAEKTWKKDFLDEPLMGAILALILPRLPNLQELTILDVYNPYWKMFEFVIDAMTAACQDPKTGVTTPFPKLEKVNMGGADCNSSIPEYPHSTLPLTIIAKWPSVKAIDGKQIGDGDSFLQENPDKWFLDLKPRSTNYTSLTFRPNSKFLGEHLVRFLDQHKKTLKSITLQLYVMETEDEYSIFTPMNFKEYAALRHLNIAFDLLFGYSDESPPDATAAQNHIVDALPESLETLEIVQCETEEHVRAATAAVRTVLRQKEERWPRLEKIMVAVEDPGWDSLKGIQKGLQDEGETHGVKFVPTRCRECYVNGLEFGAPVQNEDESGEDGQGDEDSERGDAEMHVPEEGEKEGE
ncbi:uncharacterized protein N0V89_001431 [Didymosphaeria variabile]|uniref:Uncharacterized protein n=1 Tax=Didymosphaeria variabile TaxID=1932322 RepID=A0A9W8XW89_9PLEO|nr:uncharacterized protein N0V89_001431 [Didymosphaeria variabile]KAJ4360864.1 hypothetical protein N0V89_001431 [Didymosphaeria variabile]